ncbi:MAG: hypothetical protein IPI81_08690 [Flavobacteriales bacterium]|nr:hypothetical protein [Flavobacteriales bacterium]MCC6938943.1 hypothetical protein [Flavobacteriales bacterium]
MNLPSLARAGAWVIPAIVVVNAIWVFFLPAFTTLDGWCHLQTARMLFNGYDHSVFCSNPMPVPNILGHLVLGSMQLLVPGLVAERIVLFLIVCGLGLGTYCLARTYGKVNPLVLLALPFTYNFLLVLGFHNFLLGIGIAFLFAAWWIQRRRMRWSAILLFVAASGVLYFTHTMGVAVFLLLTGMHELCLFLLPVDRSQGEAPRRRWARLLKFGIACVPALSATLLFNSAQSGYWSEPTPSGNFAELIDLSVMGMYGGDHDIHSKFMMKWLIAFALIMALVFRSSSRTSRRFLPGDVLGILAVIVIGADILLPDDTGYANYLTKRLQLLSMFLVVAWVAIQRIPLWVSVIPALGVLVLQGSRLDHAGNVMSDMAHRVEQVGQAASHLPKGSVVLPISFEDNWLLGHIPSLLAAEHDLTLLDNYECAQNYFPLVWCEGLPPGLRNHLLGLNNCFDWFEAHDISNAAPVIESVVVIGYGIDPSRCGYQEVVDVLGRHYMKTFENDYTRIYERSGR